MKLELLDKINVLSTNELVGFSKEVNGYIEVINNLVVDVNEDNITDYQTFKAKINAGAKLVGEKRKEWYKAQTEESKQVFDELMLLEKTMKAKSKEYDEALKVFEKKEHEKKMKIIEEYFTNFKEEFRTFKFVDFKKYLESTTIKYENKTGILTATMKPTKKVIEDIGSFLKKFANDFSELEQAKNFELPNGANHKQNIYNEYLRNDLNMAGAISKCELEAEKLLFQIEQAKKEGEEKAKRQAEYEKQQAELRHQQELQNFKHEEEQKRLAEQERIKREEQEKTRIEAQRHVNENQCKDTPKSQEVSQTQNVGRISNNITPEEELQMLNFIERPTFANKQRMAELEEQINNKSQTTKMIIEIASNRVDDFKDFLIKNNVKILEVK